MKKLFIFLLLSFAFLFLQESIAQSPNSIDTVKAQSAKSDLAPKLTMDGVTLFTGVYLPFHDETKGIYGNSFITGIQYALNMGRSIDIMASVGLALDSGNPYYDVSTFSSSKSSKISFVPMEISLRKRIALIKNSMGLSYRGLYGGIGINYINVKEEIPDFLLAKGGDFGLQIFAGPQIFFKDRFAFEGEVKLVMNNVGMKYQDESDIQDKDYIINLYGVAIRLALSWYY